MVSLVNTALQPNPTHLNAFKLQLTLYFFLILQITTSDSVFRSNYVFLGDEQILTPS